MPPNDVVQKMSSMSNFIITFFSGNEKLPSVPRTDTQNNFAQRSFQFPNTTCLELSSTACSQLNYSLSLCFQMSQLKSCLFQKSVCSLKFLLNMLTIICVSVCVYLFVAFGFTFWRCRLCCNVGLLINFVFLCSTVVFN